MILKGKAGIVAIGRLTKDADFKMVGKEGDKPLAKFSIGVGNKEYLNDISCWHGLAKYADKLKKGDTVLVVGTETSREYQGKTYYGLDAEFVLLQPEHMGGFAESEAYEPCGSSAIPDGSMQEIPPGGCPF